MNFRWQHLQVLLVNIYIEGFLQSWVSRQYRFNFCTENCCAMDEGTIVSHREILNVCVLALRYFGLWAPHPDSSKMFQLFYPVYNKFMLALMCTYTGTIVADLCVSYRNLMIVTDDGCFIAGVSVIIFKLFNFQICRERIENLINAIHDPVDTLRCSSDQAVVTLVKTIVLYERMTSYFFSSLGGFLVIAAIFFVPTENGSLPIRAKYPFDTTIQPMHEIAFLIEASAVTTAIVTVLAMDTMVIGFCRFTHLQLQVLNSNYENCQSSSSERGYLKVPKDDLTTSFFGPEEDLKIRSFVPFDRKEVNEVEDNFVKRFKTCVKHHQRLIQIVDDTNDLFSSSLLAQLCASSFLICLCGFQAILGSNETADLMKYGSYLAVSFSQLLCWCCFGNKLIYQSDSLAASQWFSGWENERDFSSVTVLMIVELIRTRRAMALTAGNFYTMSLETFVGILRGSYSFFALLSTVKNEDNK